MNLFIISDKQGAGKTFISAGLAATMQSLGYPVGYYKPVQLDSNVNSNGFANSQDVTFVKKFDPNVSTSVSYTLQSNALPFLAAQQEGIIIKPQVLVKDYLKLAKTCEIVLIESWGGIFSPISEEVQTVEFIQAIKASMLMVVEPSHYVFDNLILALNMAQHLGVKIAGVILNKTVKSSDINIKKLPELIEYYAGVPVIGIVGLQQNIIPSEIIDTILHSVDIETLFSMQIPKLNNISEN